MIKAIHISIITLLVSLTTVANADNSNSALSASKLITQAELMLILPDDADLRNIRRQQKAYEKGFYWTKSKTLKPLDRKG